MVESALLVLGGFFGLVLLVYILIRVGTVAHLKSKDEFVKRNKQNNQVNPLGEYNNGRKHP